MSIYRRLENTEFVQLSHLLQFFQIPTEPGAYESLKMDIRLCKNCGHLIMKRHDEPYKHVLLEGTYIRDLGDKDATDLIFHSSNKCEIIVDGRENPGVEDLLMYCICEKPEPDEFEEPLYIYVFFSDSDELMEKQARLQEKDDITGDE